MSVLNSPQALLLVLGETGPGVTEAEFHDWYDNEHAPARLTVEGFNSAFRYRAADAIQPTWLALYDLSSPDVMSSDGYNSLRVRASQREADVVSRLLMLDRRLYAHISTLTNPSTSPADFPSKYLLLANLEPTAEDEADFNKWYEEEHMDCISKVPGWLRGRRYKLVSQTELGGRADKSKEGGTIRYLAVHEFTRRDFMELDEIKKAMSTPWAVEILKKVVKREARIFELYKDFERPQWE